MILSIDCATKTGWCLYDGRVHESGVMDFSKRRGESNGAMFLRFRRWLSDLIASVQDLEMVVYEQAHHRGGAATEICVNLTGRVQEICSAGGIEYASIHTGTLKKRATGRGNASKTEMIEAAREHLGRQSVDDNEADAVLMAVMAWEDYGRHD